MIAKGETEEIPETEQKIDVIGEALKTRSETEEFSIFLENREIIDVVKEENQSETNNELLNTQYPCNECGKEFATIITLQRHENIHTGRKDDICDVCNKAFRQNGGGLYAHKRYYCKNSVKLEACENCPKKFSTKGDLNRHKILHTGEKPFKCDICMQLFSRAGNLKSHMNSTHFFEKAFQCNVCDAKFTRSNHIKDHMMTHTDERPFDCELCGNSFRRKRDLAYHIKSKVHRAD